MITTAATTTGTGSGSLSVLHVAQPTDGGVARYVVAAAADQVARGWTVTVACPDTGWLAGELRRRGIPHVTWSARRAPGPWAAGETVRLRAVVDAVAPDLVHLHSAKAGLAGRLALRGALPTLFQPHGWSWLAATGAVAALSRRWEKFATRWADQIVCVGDGEAAQAEAAGVAGAVRVVRNGVDLDRFHPADLGAQRAARAELGLSPTAPLAVCPARWARQKGQDVLLAAWAAVRAQCADAQLALVGGDAPEDLVPPEGVRLVGDVPDVRPWLAAADVVVLPSRWEGLSLALLEAMAVGRSTVVTAIPGLADVVDERVGATVPAEQADALAAAVARRLNDPSLTLAEGAAAAAKATAELDARTTFDRLAELTATTAAPTRRITR
jgi:glycosyltransferase involved in cell wall biosynthesis